MSPEQENALARKIDAIHDALVGPLGIEEDGLLWRTRNHGERITALERWRWYIVGIFTAIAAGLKLWVSGK